MLKLVHAAHFMTIMVQSHHLEAVLLLPTCKETALKGRTHNESVIA